MTTKSVERLDLEKFIKEGNLPELENYVKKLADFQKNILNFNEPSLVLLAVEVYLNPVCMTNIQYQLELIVFLLKCGLSLFVPHGSTAVYIMDLGAKWGVPETRILELLGVLVDWDTVVILSERVSESMYPYYQSCGRYLERNWAAFKIQRFWKSKRKPKKSDQEQSKDEILLELE